MRTQQNSTRHQHFVSKFREEQLHPSRHTPAAVLAQIALSAMAWFGLHGRVSQRGAETVFKSRTQGRNAPCRCGSGKKFKRCCGKE